MNKSIIIIAIALLMFLLTKKFKVKKMDEIKNSSVVPNEKTKIEFKDNTDFIRKMAPIARAIQTKYKIPYLFLLAQTALETGWGKSSLVKEAANFAGIKAVAGQPFITKYTVEYVKNPLDYPKRDVSKDVKQPNGTTKIFLPQNFAVFKDLQDGLNSYVKVLLLPRYKNAYKYTDVPNFAREIRAGGYATDPNYVSKIVNLATSIEKTIKANNF